MPTRRTSDRAPTRSREAPTPSSQEVRSSTHSPRAEFILRERELLRSRTQPSMFDFPVDRHSPTLAPAPSRRPPMEETESRRSKRRRLIPDRMQHPNGFKGFQYGKYGQADPGPLDMQICRPDQGSIVKKSAQNLLYSYVMYPAFNLLVQHQGETIFSLTELVIKTPDLPPHVVKGAVFVSLNSNELLIRTADYRVQYKSSAGDSIITSAVRMDQPVDREGGRRSAVPAPTAQHDENDSVRAMTQGLARARVRARRLSETDDRRTAMLPPTEMVPHEFDKTAAGVKCTTECGYDSDDGVMTNRLRMQASPAEMMRDQMRDWPTSEAELARRAALPTAFADIWRASQASAMALWEGPAGVDPSAAAAGDSSSSSSSSSSSAGAVAGTSTGTGTGAGAGADGRGERTSGSNSDKLMVPHARFSIADRRNKCTVQFDPPLTGRSLLIKFWTEQPYCQIGLVTVMAKGFAGPRFCPAVEWR